jgi:hypothetical protein
MRDGHPRALPAGTDICIMWDANHATNPGPDITDILLPEGEGSGEGSFSCTTFNDAGFFWFDPGLVISQPVPSDSSWYYVKVCANDCQWHSSSFQVLSGPSDVILTPSDWTCSDSGCSFGGDSESSAEESNENTVELTFENAMPSNSVDGLTI